MHFLITAGPTHEYLDAVRYLTNPSSGRMGFAVARAARRRGHTVDLVTGPVLLRDPQGITVTRVVSALELRRATLAALGRADAVVMAAAVGDYRPARRVAGKLKKTGGAVTLALVENPDILREIGRKKGRRVIVGFAVEVQDAEANARRKLVAKGADLIVLNGPASFGAERAGFRLITAGGEVRELPDASKAALGTALVRWVERRAAAAGRGARE
ncbi:MAG: phosphopantothenoylcysteine decarboxylase [Planctomycetes bacterium]|nr:phosphopantothenoylcysteine decarboxylase [Planctomycetota bacterium]